MTNKTPALVAYEDGSTGTIGADGALDVSTAPLDKAVTYVRTMGKAAAEQRVILLIRVIDNGLVGQTGRGDTAKLKDGAEWGTWGAYAAAVGISAAQVTIDKRMADLYRNGLRPFQSNGDENPDWSLISDLATTSEVSAVFAAAGDKIPAKGKVVAAAKAAKARKANATGGGQSGTTGTTAGNTPAAPVTVGHGEALAAAFKAIRDLLPVLDAAELNAALNGAVTLQSDIRTAQVALTKSA